MMWLIWRQHRKQALFTVAALAALAAFIVPTGLMMRGTYADLGLASCVGPDELSDRCHTALNQFMNRYEPYTFIGVLFLALPLLVGLFWGAPLVAREVEQGTHRFVWTQGVSRRRWAAAKLGVVGVGVATMAIGYGFGVSWWFAPLSDSGQLARFAAFLFDMQGLTPAGYTIFAVALGVFAGTVWPRLLPAMGVTLAGFIGLRVALAALGRPRYVEPEARTIPIIGGGPINDHTSDWILARQIRNPDGSVLANDAMISCPEGVAGPDGRPCGADIGALPGAYNWHLYQPADRFWLFQSIETGIYVALAALLLYLAVRRLRRIA